MPNKIEKISKRQQSRSHAKLLMICLSETTAANNYDNIVYQVYNICCVFPI